MRLTPHEVAAIKAATAEVFGPDAVVRLFGSRVNDDFRGGDIDLQIDVAEAEDPWRLKCDFESALFKRIDEQRVDVLVTPRTRPLMAIEKIALRDGIVL